MLVLAVLFMSSALRAALGETAVPAAPEIRQAPAQPPPKAETPRAEEPAPIIVRDDANQLELKLPAPYWNYRDRRQLLSTTQGGCARPRIPESLLFVLEHKDALARAWCEKGTRPFLMRDRGDLETFVNGFVEAIRKQVGAAIEDAEAVYQERDGMIVHRWAFTMPVRSGGCGAQAPAGPQQKMRYVFVQYFVRPKDSDALDFKLLCMAPVEVMAELKPELEYIIGGFRYTGAVAEDFFVPDAPEGKVPGAKGGEQAAGVSGASRYWLLLAVGLIVTVWLLSRRRKKTQA